jgi:hypothetical protein
LSVPANVLDHYIPMNCAIRAVWRAEAARRPAIRATLDALCEAATTPV